MTPLADMDRARLAHARGVIFDIDDTVTRDGRLEAVAFDAMWKLQRAGVLLVPITGRPLGWVDVIARHWPVALAAGENGAGWVSVRPGGVHEGYYDPAETREKQRALVATVEKAVLAALPHVHLSADHRARRCDLAFDIGELDHLPAAEVARIVEIIEAHGARATTSSVHAHVVPGAWDKAKGACAAVRDVLSFDLRDADERSKWFFIGDSPNDMEAFGFFENSVGVANIRSHLHNLTVRPKFITTANHGAGFAELAHAILGAKP